MKVLLDEYPKIEVNIKEYKLVFFNIEKCKIDTEEGKIVCKHGTSVPQALRERFKTYLNDLERKGIVRKSESQWKNPIKVLEKPDWNIKLVSNLMLLKDLTTKDSYRIPEMKGIIEEMLGANFLTVLDLKESYYQVEIEEDYKKKTAFEFENKVYKFCGMVMEFKNTPMIMKRILLEKIFGDMVGGNLLIYIDDLIIYFKTIEEHEIFVREVFKI